MSLQRSVSFAPTGRPISQARRGTFALESVEALPRLADRISRLAERTLEPNPFFLPEFLQPAIQAFGRKGLKLATFFDRDELRFFAPVQTFGGGLLGRPRLSVWTHAFAPLGTPLIDVDMATQVADGLLQHMNTSGRTLLSVPDLPLKGPAAQALRAAAKRSGFWTEAGRQLRPILKPGGNGVAEFDQMVAPKRRKELDRQLRRLCETGAVSFMAAQTPAEIDAAFEMFSSLEAAGWKGRRGTAIKRRRAVHDFARTAVMQLAEHGIATIDLLRVGDRPLAALIRFDHAGLSVPWKIAFDEEFAAASPGRQLICDETRRWLADPAILRVDPICEEANPLLRGLWNGREPYGTLLISSRRLGIRARLNAGIIDLRKAGKAQAKALLRGRGAGKRKPRPPRPS